jgi:predicted MFS family arabinose efflux permease
MATSGLLANRHVFIGGLGLGQICSWGSIYYSFPQIAEAMRQELGYSKPELYGAATLGLVLAGVAAYPVGAAIDRGHGRAIMTGASVLAGLLLAAWSQISDLVLFYGLFAGIGLLQAATLYEPAFAVVARRFGAADSRRGITALTLWGGFASTAFIPLIELLLNVYGWRGTLVALGGVNLLLCAGLYAAVIDPRADAESQAGAVRAAPGRGREVVREMFRQPAFWALTVAFVAFHAAFSAFTFHIYPMLIERGFDAASTVAAIAIIGPAQVAGRVLIWLFWPHASVRLIGSIIVAVFPLALLALGAMPVELSLLALFAAVYGAVNGIMTIVRGMAVPEMLTREAYGAVNGVMTAPSAVVRALAPAGAALLWSVGGSYDTVLWAIVAGAVATMLCFWLAALFSARIRP